MANIVDLLRPSIFIPANADLNSEAYCSQIGVYSCQNDTITATLTNCPVSKAFIMYVLSPLHQSLGFGITNQWNYRYRILFQWQNDGIYTQRIVSYSDNSIDYSPWKKITTTTV